LLDFEYAFASMGHLCIMFLLSGLEVLEPCNSDDDCDPNTMQCVDKGDGSKKCCELLLVGQ